MIQLESLAQSIAAQGRVVLTNMAAHAGILWTECMHMRVGDGGLRTFQEKDRSPRNGKRLGGQIISVHYTTLRNVGFVNRPWEAMEGFGGLA